MRKFKKTAITLALLLVVGLATPAAVNAVSKTVRYKGVAVYWEYGRTMSQLWSYSQVGTHKFKKRARANGATSGWKKAKAPDAYAEKFIGTGTARCYWYCK